MDVRPSRWTSSHRPSLAAIATIYRGTILAVVGRAHLPLGGLAAVLFSALSGGLDLRWPGLIATATVFAWWFPLSLVVGLAAVTDLSGARAAAISVVVVSGVGSDRLMTSSRSTRPPRRTASPMSRSVSFVSMSPRVFLEEAHNLLYRVRWHKVAAADHNASCSLSQRCSWRCPWC